jgi:hypothetical protein
MMSIIFVTADMRAKLAQSNAPAELLSDDGQLLGYFTPVKAKKYAIPEMTEEEANARIAEGGGRKLADILRDLEARR